MELFDKFYKDLIERKEVEMFSEDMRSYLAQKTKN